MPGSGETAGGAAGTGGAAGAAAGGRADAGSVGSVLFELDSYDRRERTVVDILGRRDLSPEAAVARIGQLAEALRAWRPGPISLADHLATAKIARMKALSTGPSHSRGARRRPQLVAPSCRGPAELTEDPLRHL